MVVRKSLLFNSHLVRTCLGSLKKKFKEVKEQHSKEGTKSICIDQPSDFSSDLI